MISLPIFQGALSSAADVPSLDLNFSGPSGFFAAKGATPTLTRGSVATYTDSAGVLRTTNSNILLQSNGFNTGSWTPVNATITSAATISPDGQLNAFELKDTVSTGIHEYFQFNISFISGLTYTFSFYAKQSGKRYCTVNGGINAFGGQDFATYDLLNGVVSQKGVSGTAEIVSVGNGWWRCIRTIPCIASVSSTISIVHSPIAAPGYQYSYTGDGTGFYIYGAQIEQASYAGPYSPTTTAATNNGPRIDYDPVTLACKGLLIEEFRSNSTPGSNDFSNATYWSTASNVTITPTATISPDGTLNAFELKDTASNTLHQLIPATNLNVTTGTNYTFSFYAKKSGKRYVSTNRAQAIFGTEDYVIFDLELGIITFKATGGTATITPVGNGWYRCTHTLPAIVSGIHGAAGAISLATAGTFTGRAETYIGNGTGIYIYGAQFEVGTFPTSYIPTTTAAGNRGTENCYITGTNFSSWFNGTEGTFVVDFRVGVVSPSYTTILVASDGGTLTNNIRYAHQNSLNADVWSGSSVVAQSPSPSYSIDTLYKSAIAYKANDFAFCLDSGAVSVDTAGAVPTGINQLVLASGYSAGGGTTNTKITLSRVRYYNKRLANSRLQQRTSPTILDWRSVGPVHWPNYKASIENSAIGATDPTTFTVGPAHGRGAAAFTAGVVASNGKVILTPFNSTRVGIYDPVTNLYTDGAAHGQAAGSFLSSVLTKEGNIVFVPHSLTNIGLYNPITDIYTVGPSHAGVTLPFAGGVLAPNGKVIFVPYNSTTVGIYDPIANTYTNGPLHGRGASAFVGGVLAPNGKIIFIPASSSGIIGIYDPVANTYTNGPAATTGFHSGVLAPNGKIIFIPIGSPVIGIYDSVNNTYSSGPAHGKGGNAFVGGVLTPSGKIIMAPFGSTNVGIYDPSNNTYSNGPVNSQGSTAFYGAVLALNEKVVFVPFGSPNVCIMDGGTGSFNDNVSLSAYYNKF